MTSTRRARSFLASLLLGAHVWLAPFAHMDPPDPLWMGGIFDESDYDDVVLLVMAMTSVVDSRPALEAPAEAGVFEGPVPRPDVHHVFAGRTRPIRAPPSV